MLNPFFHIPFFSPGDSGGSSLPSRGTGGLVPPTVPVNPAFKNFIAGYRNVSKLLGLNVISNKHGRPEFEPISIESLRSYFDHQLVNVEESLGKKIKNLILGISGDLDSASTLVMMAETLNRANRNDIRLNLFHAESIPQPSRDERIKSLVDDLKENYPKLEIVLNNHNISPVIEGMETSLGGVSLGGRDLAGAVHDAIQAIRNYYRRKLIGACVVGSTESTELFLGNATQNEFNVLWNPILYLPKPIVEQAFREVCRFRSDGGFDRRWEWPIKNSTSFQPWIRVGYEDDLPVLHASPENPFSPLTFNPETSSLSSTKDSPLIFEESGSSDSCKIPGRIQWIGAPICHIIVDQFENFLYQPTEVVDGIVRRFPRYESDIKLVALLFCEARRLMAKDQTLGQLASSGINSVASCDYDPSCEF